MLLQFSTTQKEITENISNRRYLITLLWFVCSGFMKGRRQYEWQTRRKSPRVGDWKSAIGRSDGQFC
jgi:hypothetical protein